LGAMWKSLVLAVGVAACGGSNAADVDAPSGGSGNVDAAGPTCRPKSTTTLSDGHHNPGQDCMGSCHNHGFTAAGTLFTAASSSTPVTAATITVVDAAGHSVDLVTQQNGNFYTSVALTYPITVYASSCPTLVSMTSTINSTTKAGCNQGGTCHGGTEGKIHLP